MNAHKLRLGLATALLATAAISASVFVACSSSNGTNPAPTVRDAGPDSTSKTDAPTSHADGNTGKDTGPPGTDGGQTKDSGHSKDTGGGVDSGPPDTGACKSDSGTCNSCYTAAQAASNPYTACSPYTKNCVPFTTTVPSHPQL
jgi:hypothetical protein